MLHLARVTPLVVLTAFACAQDHKRAMTFRDVMQFKSIRSSAISDDGKLVTCVVQPDRGDGELMIFSIGRGWDRIRRGTNPRIGADSKFVIATVVPPFLADGKDKPKNALAIANIQTSLVETIADVERAVLSKDGRFVAWQPFAKPADKKTDKEKKKKKKDRSGRTVVLRNLAGGEETKLEWVTRFDFSPNSDFLTFVVNNPKKPKANGIFHRHLLTQQVLGKARDGVVGNFAWSETGRVAFTHALEGVDGELGETTIYLEDRSDYAIIVTPEPHKIVAKDLGRDATLRNDTKMEWSKDGKRLLFGVHSKSMEALVKANAKRKTKESTEAAKKRLKKDPFAFDAILADREVDVWHTRDPLINSNQKKSWSAKSKRSYQCAFDFATGKSVRLADANMADVSVSEGSPTGLGRSNRLYQRQITWDGRYSDYFLVDMKTGKRRRVLRRQSGPVILSPNGRYLVWYGRGHWLLRDDQDGKRRNLTRALKVPFANEDHDYPRAAPGYGIGGWFKDESGVLIYDKFDVWLFTLDGGSVKCLTSGEGRKAGRQMRVVDVDPESDFLDPRKPLLMTGFDEETKGWSVWSCDPARPGARQLLATDDRIRIVAKAKNADRILYTREDYDRFPDLHVCDLSFENTTQITKLDEQRKPFNWGTAELIDWRNTDGRRIQGAVIKPGDYDPKKRYPVLVYYYRFFSQRVNEWNQMAVNHRPNFPFYASNGYVVFLPDIRFDVGQPGYAATKCLVPGVQKLIELGIADPKAIALHGHSWSGYQTAFVITQSHLFACAIAGAPVSNMTSAYGGIRWGTGLSRQFQYEKTQSRIGGSLWEYPERYIENSPVFFADRIKTPLLIQFGDEDGAVPWYQGIELYMAMRRLDKPCVFLQYRKEPHHLKKYANKLDYSIKFKEYVDHYCRGTRAPKWIRQGVPYTGR